MSISATEHPHSIPVVILANGASSRFGTPKSEALLGGKSLIQHVFDRMRAQTDAQILVNSGKPIEGILDPTYLPDLLGPDLGPLAGVHAALSWAASNQQKTVATVSVDTPFLPSSLLQRFAQTGAPCFASSNGRHHPAIGLWANDSVDLMDQHLEAGNRSVHSWLEACGAKSVAFEPEASLDPFFNINTVEALARAEALLHAS